VIVELAAGADQASTYTWEATVPMKLKALLLALAVAGAGASYALADDGHHDGGTTSTSAESTTTNSTTHDCKRFNLKGTLASSSGSSFLINVLKANDGASSLVGTTVTVAVTPDTRVSWSGRGTLNGPNVGDSAHVNGKQCGGDTAPMNAKKAEFRAPHTHGDSK
jgi:hypothetical protein